MGTADRLQLLLFGGPSPPKNKSWGFLSVSLQTNQQRLLPGGLPMFFFVVDVPIEGKLCLGKSGNQGGSFVAALMALGLLGSAYWLSSFCFWCFWCLWRVMFVQEGNVCHQYHLLLSKQPLLAAVIAVACSFAQA